MFGKDLLLADVRYSEWATRRLLEAAATLTPAELARDLGHSHRSVIDTLRHYFVSEEFWVQCLIANALPPMDEIGDDGPQPQISFADLLKRWPEVWESLERWMEGLSEADLAEAMPCRLSATRTRNFPRWEILRHNVNHATLHRGQIVSMLRQLGKQPPNVDIIGYYMR
jgi:uncharacterized damage-inducible protein DinB